MDTVKKYNEKLNNSYDADKVYDLWANYRNDISNFLKYLDVNEKNVLIIGSGHLNDLDLNHLKSSSMVTFVDIDIENTKKGYARQGIGLDHQFLSMDISSMSHTDFIKRFSFESDDRQIDLLKEFKNFSSPFDIDIFDIIIILPIYTQLLLPQLLPYISSDAVLNEVMTFIAYRIQIFNHEMHAHLADSGQILVLSDILEYQTESEQGLYLQAHQNQKFILEDQVMSYINQYGHGLGSFGLANISSGHKVIKEDYFYWPFDDKKILIVGGKIIKKQSL